MINTSKKTKSAALLGALLYSSFGFAQLNLNNVNLGDIHGNFQADAQYYIADSSIGAYEFPGKMGLNGFANIIYTRGKFTAGVRYESYLNALQGFTGYDGNAIPYRFASYKSDALEVTVGSFYQQFGNGLILRSYEERGLGVDNALDGIRLKYEPVKGIYLTGLTGKQRAFMTTGVGIVRGFDGEMQVNETFKRLNDKELKVTLGGSFVSRYQKDDDPDLILPENVGAYAGRMQVNYKEFNLNTELAYKINDPNAANSRNGKIYKPGNAQILNASYATKGLAISLGASRADNMHFRSDRNAYEINRLILNYTPALNKQHTYSLLTFYPYASQPNGEFQYSSEVNYKIFKSAGYKVDITVNYSGSNDLDTTKISTTDNYIDPLMDGYRVKSYAWGKTRIFRDFYVELNQKFGKKVKSSLIYSYQEYNKDVLSEPGFPMIYSDIVVADVSYRLKKEGTIRVEAQHLSTRQDKQNWASLLLEYTINSHWFVAAMDLYNYENEHKDIEGNYDERIHYYNVSAGFNKNANRITLSYGKQRAGIFCVGGVCRPVPASNGIMLTVTSSF